MTDCTECGEDIEETAEFCCGNTYHASCLEAHHARWHDAERLG